MTFYFNNIPWIPTFYLLLYLWYQLSCIRSSLQWMIIVPVYESMNLNQFSDYNDRILIFSETMIQMLLCIIFFYITTDLLHFIFCWFFLKFPCHQFYRLKIQNDTLERALRTVEETSEVRTILLLFSFSLTIFLILIVFTTHFLLFSSRLSNYLFNLFVY